MNASPAVNHTRVWQLAEDELLAEMDTYTDWLGGHCQRRDPVRLGYIDTRPEALLIRCERATVDELAALSLYPNAAVCFAACQALRERYVRESAESVCRLAADVRIDMEEGETV